MYLSETGKDLSASALPMGNTVLLTYKEVNRYWGKILGQHPDIIVALSPGSISFSIEKLREPGDEANIITALYVLPIFLHKYHYSVLSIGKVHYQGCLVTGVSINFKFHLVRHFLTVVSQKRAHGRFTLP